MGRWRQGSGWVVALALGLGLAPGCHRGASPARPPLVGAIVLPAFDPAAQADGRPPELGPLPPLELRDYGPEGVRHEQPIRLRLNQPVVDLRQPPAQQPAAALTLWVAEPSGEASEVPAQARWTAPDTLELQPDEPLPAATGFEVRFGGGLTNREGSRVEGVSWRFETLRPTVQWLEDWEAVATDVPLYMVADQPVRAEVLAEHLRVTVVRSGATPRAVPVRVQSIELAALPPYWQEDVQSVDDPQGPSIFAIAPHGRWPAGAKARLEVDSGLYGDAGPLTLAEPYAAELRFRDVMQVHGLECERPRGRTCEPGWMTLRLSNRPGEGELEKIEVIPRPDGLDLWTDYDYGPEDEDQDEDGYEDEGERRTIVTIAGDFEPERRYRITVPASFADEHGQTLGRRFRKTVSIRPEASELEVEGEVSLVLSSKGGTFLQPEDARVGIIGRHVEQARIRVATLEPAAALALVRTADLGAQSWPSAATTTVVLRTLSTQGEDARAEEALALDRFGGHGDMLLVELTAEALTAKGRREQQPEPARGLFQISNLGAVVDLGPARGVVRVTRATDGEPWPDVEAELHTPEGTTPLPRSDAHGLVALPGARALGNDVVLVLRDAASGDRLMLPLRDYRWFSSQGSVHWSWPDRHVYRGRESVADATRAPPEGLQLGERALVGVQVGRGVYLPGDSVHAAGWASIATPHREISTRRMKAGTPVVVELRHDDEVVASRRTTVSRHGRFTATLTVPPTAALGDYEVRAQALESWSRTSLVVADTRIPVFEIEASASPRSLVRGETTMLRARAGYLSGEPAPMEQLRWSLRCSPTHFMPKGYDWPWSFTSSASASSHERSGTLTPKAAAARLQVELGTSALESSRPHRCSVSVAGQDVSFQEVGAETRDFFVHPARVYVGVRVPRDPVAGERLEVLVDAVDVRGARVALPGVELTIVRDPENDVRKVEQPPPVEVARCRFDVATTGERPRCTVAAPLAGHYEVLATATIDGVPIETGASVRVEPPPPPPEPKAEAAAATPATSSDPTAPQRSFRIDRPDEIEAGRPARIEIEAPWDEGSGMLTVTQTGLREAIPFELRDGRAEVSVTPRAGRGPRVELQATVARPGDGTVLPELEQTDTWAKMIEARALTVTIDAPKKARPGRDVPLRLSVRDHEGDPVDARLAVWVVDEGLHQLREPAQVPLEVIFDPDRPGDRQRTHSYDALLRPFVPWLARRVSRSPRVRSAAGHGRGSLELSVRQRFEAVPLFEGDVGTGPDGDVELTLSLPDDLTRFRISAVASAELEDAVGKASGPARFGRAAAQLEVSLPMIVRAALPRVLRPGDAAEAAALVITPPKQPGTLVVEASLRDAEGVLALAGPAQRRLHVDGSRPARVTFDVRALGPGEPGVRFVARFVPDDEGSGTPLRSGVERRLEVEVERTQIERAALYGRIDRDGPVAIPVLVPEGVRPDHGGLTLALRSTVLGDLDDAARYLVEYPHGCLEQTASRLLPLVALGRLADRLPPGVADPEAFVADTLSYLLSMQHTDGTFGYWPDSRAEAPYAGAYATWVMQLAAEAGHPVPTEALERAQQALRARLLQPLPDGAWEREHARAERTLAAYTLARAGKGGDGALGPVLDDLFDHRDALPVFSRAQLLMALHALDPADPRVAVVRRQLSTSIESLPGHAHVVADHGARHAQLFDSPARSQALVLLAFLQVAPDDPRVDELARGLTQQRHGAYWRNTQENAYALLAMAGYAREREAEVPDHRVEAWIGPRRALTVEHRGRETKAHEAALSMQALLGPVGSDRTTHVVLDREGTGALFYRVGMEWTGTEPGPARSQGLALQRTLMNADGERAASAELQVGQRYAIEVVVETDAPQHYLAIEVPLPAGLEAIDTRLGHGAAARGGSAGRGWWMSHEELRRDRVVLFADTLAPGRHVHTIHVLATTPGRYVLPAAVAEAMYTPEVRARTTAGRLRVKGKP